MRIKKMFVLVIVISILFTSICTIPSKASSDFNIENGVLTKWTGTDTAITIPDSVIKIGNNAFKDCIGLTNVIIPNSVTSIGNNAFAGCIGITNVIIPNSVTSIGEGVFFCCVGLTSVTISNSITSISDLAFFGCTGLTNVTIPNSATSIGDTAFSCCTGLTSVTIPNSVTSIGPAAFFACTGLTNVTIPNSVTNIGYHAFQECTGLTSMTIPNSITSISEGTFSDCTGLTNVTIPNSVTSIDWIVFSGCTGLTSVTIGNSVTSIGNGAFNGCKGLTSVTIPNSVTSIDNETFSNCTGLTSAIFLGNEPSMGSRVFASCAPNFKVYYISGNTGFTNPWYGYPTESIVFPDVNPTNYSWAQESIEYLATQGIINGSVVDGQIMYLPANTITRAELCKLIIAAYGFTQDGEAKQFTDTTGHWAANYIAIASSLEIVTGYGDNTFMPNAGISRQELAVMISRAMAKKNVGIQIADNEIEANLGNFVDQENISSWARKDVAFAVLNEIIKGSPAEGGGLNFLPHNKANRAETAVMIKRAYDKLG